MQHNPKQSRLDPINNNPLPDKFLNPTNGDPITTTSASMSFKLFSKNHLFLYHISSPILFNDFRTTKLLAYWNDNLLALPCIRKLLMITHQVIMVPWVILQLLIILKITKHDLTKAVKVGYICHLWVIKLGHKRACGGRVVNLFIISNRCGTSLFNDIKACIKFWSIAKQSLG